MNEDLKFYISNLLKDKIFKFENNHLITKICDFCFNNNFFSVSKPIDNKLFSSSKLIEKELHPINKYYFLTILLIKYFGLVDVEYLHLKTKEDEIYEKLLTYKYISPEISFTEQNPEEIEKRIISSCIDFVGLNKLLIETNSIISGSFVTQCLLNEDYLGSDIDIYVNSRETLLKFKNFFCSYLGDDGRYFWSLGSHHIEFGDTKINLIFINCENFNGWEDFVINNFDFSFCMNFYDGKFIYFNIETIGKQSKLYNSKGFNTNNYNRILKYIERGFFIDDFSEYQLLIK
jgi:hypothetical protein